MTKNLELIDWIGGRVGFVYLRNKTWTDKTLSESERRLLKSAIKKRTKEHHRLVLERDRLTMRTSETLSSIDRYILHKSIDHNVKNRGERIHQNPRKET